MIRKQIGDWVVVCMTTFFNLDKSFCHQAYLSIITAMSTVKLLAFMTMIEFHAGILTVKDDAFTIRETLNNALSAIENNDIYAGIIQSAREFKENLPDKYKLS